MSDEHCCGPTREQVLDAHLRGDTLGTWPRCESCAEKEAEILKHIVRRSTPLPPFDFKRIV